MKNRNIYFLKIQKVKTGYYAFVELLFSFSLSLHNLDVSSQIGSVYVAHICFTQDYYKFFNKMLWVRGEPVQVASDVPHMWFTVFIQPTGKYPGETRLFGIIAMELILLFILVWPHRSGLANEAG